MDNILIYIYNTAPIWFMAIGLFIFTKYNPNAKIKNKYVYSLIVCCIILSIIAIINAYFDNVLQPTYSIIISEYGTLEKYAEVTGDILKDYSDLRIIVTSLRYIIRPVCVVFFWIIILKKSKWIRLWINYLPICANTIAYATNIFHRLCFVYYEDLTFAKLPLGYLSLVVSGYYALLMFFSFIKSFKLKKYNEIVYFLFLFFIYLGAALMSEKFYSMGAQPILSETLIICLVFYYLFLYSKGLEQDIEEKENEIKASQIKPHFIFNTLSSIIDLCDEDSEEQKALITFSKYLRFNIDTISQTKLVSFETELKQINIYLELEKYSYGDRIKVDYDIQIKDFLIPVLSIQPIVENSVKYGLKNKKEVSIKIITYEDENNYYINVIDDGIGFDPNKIGVDGRKHVGISNVKYRLEEMCKATLTYDSEIGKGTSALVTIPKEKEVRYNENTISR